MTGKMRVPSPQRGPFVQGGVKVLLILCSLLIYYSVTVQAATSTPEPPVPLWQDIPKKYDFRQTFKKPMFLGLPNSTAIPYWAVGGAGAVSAETTVRLASSLASQHGLISRTSTNMHAEWSVVMRVNIFGKGVVGGKGVAFWYTKSRPVPGTYFGSEPSWQGVGIFIDSSDLVQERYTPLIYAVYNDGKKVMGPSSYMQNSIGSCYRDVRNKEDGVNFRITYVDQTLLLDVDLSGKGTQYTQCFKVNRISLLTNHYFGVSSSTEHDYPDDHDVVSFETWELNSPPRADIKAKIAAREKQKAQAYEMPADASAKIDKTEEMVKQAHAPKVVTPQQAVPPGSASASSSTYTSSSSSGAGNSALVDRLTKLEALLARHTESLNLLHSKMEASNTDTHIQLKSIIESMKEIGGALHSSSSAIDSVHSKLGDHEKLITRQAETHQTHIDKQVSWWNMNFSIILIVMVVGILVAYTIRALNRRPSNQHHRYL